MSGKVGPINLSWLVIQSYRNISRLSSMIPAPPKYLFALPFWTVVIIIWRVGSGSMDFYLEGVEVYKVSSRGWGGGHKI